ncbi:LysR family transcriptional regulator [Amycolatopsis rhizosphaerae]|uniref:LysR family transcriptional regulator n=1 Tax=Amycolatopsis rhizosphaerae TaxID=2053003 RepID=A0A558CTX0_9PSEU|nr:LysR substrate-binding domain-containing protein [Amycolatopsis rhizosphaerae]TVT52228.1 LysR family transcriptional regulator [Amycolatopsis rhizosphaerae]
MSEFTVAGLRVVREAARHGSFSVAGERLGYTQSAVSRQIALMEQAAGRPLFERQARGVRLTEAGRVVLRHAEAVLGELDSVRQELEELTVRPPVRLRVGAFSTAMAALVPRAIAALVAARPQVAVSLREGPSGRLLTSVARGRLDLAVVTAPRQAPAGVEIIPVLEDPLFVAMSSRHPLADLPSAAVGMLREQRWIVGSAEPGTTLLGAWSDVSWEPEIAFVAKDWVAKLGFVAAGLGVTVVPGLIVPVLPPDIAVVRIDNPAAVRTTAIARPGDRPQDEPRREFGELLRDMSAELAADLRRRLR